MYKRQDKLLGALLGAAVGDALGALTETYTIDMIWDYFGGWVTDFVPPPPNGLSRGTTEGMVTDDFSIAYYTAEEMLHEDSGITESIAKKALIRWSEHPEYTRYAGPTTRVAIEGWTGKQLRGKTYQMAPWVLCNYFTQTNGGGMKSGLMGLFHPGDVEAAIDDAITMCMPTHDNTIALSAACAIAAATAAAMEEHATWMDAVKAGIYGAAKGYELAIPIAKPVAGPSVEKRIQLAVELGMKKQGDFEGAMRDISQIIGGGLYAYEAIPAVFGHIAACRGDLLDSIYMGVNGGDDTDTVACMTGYIVGALHGAGPIPGKHLTKINRLNHMDIGKLADDMDSFITRREEKRNG